MNFDNLPDADPDRRRLAEAVLRRAPAEGLGAVAFPGGVKAAIWFISEASDASMAAAFSTQRAQSMSDVIDLRFAQNRDLKGFVRRVMFFDLLHPVQALQRMQRTARVMFRCLGAAKPTPMAVTCLNLAYTLVVFRWLLDRSAEDAATARFSRRVMSLIGMA
ncbi:MAG: hypothetical protein U1E50_08425 [Caulobacteraceae bacterium]